MDKSKHLWQESFSIQVMQRVRLVDIQLEKFSFILLAGINSTNLKWATTLHAMSLGMESIKLSGIQTVESGSILSELKQVSESDPPRVKASAERCVRFCDDFTKQTAELFEESVNVVGEAFNVDQHAVSVFIEAVRDSLDLLYSNSTQGFVSVWVGCWLILKVVLTFPRRFDRP